MATSFVWKIKDSATMTPMDVTVDGGTMGDKIQYAGATFGTSIAVGTYNTGTYVENSAGGDDTSAITARNSRPSTMTGEMTPALEHARLNEMTTKDLDATMGGVGTGDAILTIVHSDTVNNVTIMSADFFGHQGGMTTAAPVGVDFYCYEANGMTPAASWTNADGQSMELSLDDQGTSAMSHTFHLLIAASPNTVGTHEGNAAATSGDFVMTIALRYT